MSTVTGASSMPMASLYAMLGLTMPTSSSGSGAVSPAIAMLSAANESAAAQVATLLQGMSVPSGATSGPSLTSALLGLSTLDPATELGRLSAALSSDASSLADLAR